ncbi:MAG: FkbM family methyltransferase [Acidimicrobiales bacterium]
MPADLAALAARVDEADRNFVNLAVHSTERTNELVARVADAEDRLAALEVERAWLREALRHGPGPETGGELEYWRRRLSQPGDPVPAPAGPPAAVARVATDVGALLLPAHDEVMLTHLRQHGEWEREESDHLRALLRPGMTFLDVGAHVGYMSLLAARAVGPAGRGFAFEPEPGNFALLMANLAVHGVENVEAVPAAAWSETGRLSLSLCTDNTGDHRAYALPGRESVDVPAFALDDVLPGDVTIDVVKVDAQATDDIAIRGMERTLARCRPALVVEFWPQGIRERGADPADVLGYYRSLGYDLGVLGGEHGASPETVLEAAESSPTAFCTLVLTPCA